MRAKPDLVAPGEKIISCAAGATRDQIKEEAVDCDYVEDSGTSMAAPHVSGVIAASLSVRREFIGRPERVKEIFLSTATELKREKYFQGARGWWISCVRFNLCESIPLKYCRFLQQPSFGESTGAQLRSFDKIRTTVQN